VSGEQTGAARWLSVHDDLLRGLTHALSNRLGTISAMAYVIAMQPANLEASAAGLREESERLDVLLQLLRTLPRRADGVAEPIVPTDTTAQAVALISHHPDVRDVTTTITVDGDLQPAYAEPGILVLAMTLALGAAYRAAGAGGQIVVRITSGTESVQFTALGSAADGEAGVSDEDAGHDVDAINWLLRPYGGMGHVATAGAGVTIPTLQAARRARAR
jgi:hypothetical protein